LSLRKTDGDTREISAEEEAPPKDGEDENEDDTCEGEDDDDTVERG
jgi:hypothetical protein